MTTLEPAVCTATTLTGTRDVKCVCSHTGGTLTKKMKKFGPDGDEWVVYSDKATLEAHLQPVVTANGGDFLHKCGSEVDHICSQYGNWGFEVFPGNTQLNPHAVSFYHIKVPKSYIKTYDPRKTGKTKSQIASENPDDGFYLYTWDEFLDGFDKAFEGKRNPRVWRRDRDDFIEVAINFCPIKQATTHSVDIDLSRDPRGSRMAMRSGNEDSISEMLRSDIEQGKQLIETLSEQVDDMHMAIEKHRQIITRKEAQLNRRLKMGTKSRARPPRGPATRMNNGVHWT